jgi:hypothetical protein
MSSLALRALGAGALAAALATPAAAQRMRSVTSARQLTGENRAQVRVEYGAGRLKVAPTASDLLYRMNVSYDEDHFRPVTTYDRASGRLTLGVEGRGHGDAHGGNGSHADIELTPRIPLDLSLQFGAGNADVELGGLALENVHLETGASDTRISFTAPNRVAARQVKIEAGASDLRVSGLGNTRAERFDFEGGVGSTTLDFGGQWSQNATAHIEMGIGSVRLRLPRGLGVRMTKSSFLSSFHPAGMVKRGGAWYSQGYDQARYKLDVAIDAAIGSVDVEWM